MERRVVVGFAPTPAGYQALRYAVGRAREGGVSLVVVHAVRVDLRPTWEMERLQVTVASVGAVTAGFREAMGGPPADLQVTVIVEPGPAHEVLTAVANRPGDVLVVGGTTRRHRGWRRGVAQRCVSLADCPLVVVPAPSMAREGSVGRLGRAAAAEFERILTSPATMSLHHGVKRDGGEG